MYDVGHEFVDLKRGLVALEQLHLAPHHAAVVAHGGTCLGVVGREFVYLRRRLVNEWQEVGERHASSHGSIGGEIVAAVHEIAGKHSGKM